MIKDSMEIFIFKFFKCIIALSIPKIGIEFDLIDLPQSIDIKV